MSKWLVVLGVLAACGGDEHHGDRPDARDGKGDDPGDLVDAGAISADAGDPALLSAQGVYGDFASRTIPVDAIAYDVNYELWADGATKRRWLILSPGSAPIDNSDPDRWLFPPGARLVKEFSRDGVVVETRIVERVDAASPAFSMRTYVWRADDSDADLVNEGAADVRGTAHDVPTAAQCVACHSGEVGKVLAFSAVQLPRETLMLLSSTGKLAVPIPAGTTYGPIGEPATVAALGYLHGNCGHCHNPNGIAGAFIDMTLRLGATSTPAEQATGYLTTVSAPVQFNGAGATLRIDPQNPDNSAILRRISVRGADQMPLLATEVVDPTGVATVAAWIDSL